VGPAGARRDGADVGKEAMSDKRVKLRVRDLTPAERVATLAALGTVIGMGVIVSGGIGSSPTLDDLISARMKLATQWDLMRLL